MNHYSKVGVLKLRLTALNFLEFAVWGAYLTSLGNYLAGVGLGSKIGWFYTVQGIVSLFMPAVIGIIADRYIQAQRMVSICHLLAGVFMLSAGLYGYSAGADLSFGPIFTLYTLSVAFYMPTIGIVNSVCYSVLAQNKLDAVRHFPPIRVFGTVGFICAMLFVNFMDFDGIKFQSSYIQLLTSGLLSLILSLYALTIPSCPVNRNGSRSLVDILGLRAFSLFRQRDLAIFFIFSMLLGVSLQITNGYANPFISSFENVPEFASTWGARNANALISLSQMSETLCILLIPFALRRFGIKGVMLMSMVAWVLRFGLFGLGDPGSGVWLFILSMIVYGIAFDFFNVSGSLYVDSATDSSIRSSAQGLFMIMTNGVGATIGTLAAQAVINANVFDVGGDAMQAVEGWRTSWFIFAGYSSIVAVLFLLIFRGKGKKPSIGTNEAADILAADDEM